MITIAHDLDRIADTFEAHMNAGLILPGTVDVMHDLHALPGALRSLRDKLEFERRPTTTVQFLLRLLFCRRCLDLPFLTALRTARRMPQ